MKKCYIQNLSLIVTNKCNLDCAHCLRGKKNNDTMSDKVISSTLSNVDMIGTLTLTGGEITLVLDRVEKIFNYIIENRIKLSTFNVVINGTIYSEELLELLEEINDYIGFDLSVFFSISLDKYHLSEIKKRGLLEEFKENVKKYHESKYFLDFKKIKGKIYREGNAENLSKRITTPLKECKTVITYADRKGNFNRECGYCNMGPIIAVNPNGIVTEGNASIYNQKTIYNYGNVLDDTIENIMIHNGSFLVNPEKYVKTSNKILKKYIS